MNGAVRLAGVLLLAQLSFATSATTSAASQQSANLVPCPALHSDYNGTAATEDLVRQLREKLRVSEPAEVATELRLWINRLPDRVWEIGYAARPVIDDLSRHMADMEGDPNEILIRLSFTIEVIGCNVNWDFERVDQIFLGIVRMAQQNIQRYERAIRWAAEAGHTTLPIAILRRTPAHVSKRNEKIFSVTLGALTAGRDWQANKLNESLRILGEVKALQSGATLKPYKDDSIWCWMPISEARCPSRLPIDRSDPTSLLQRQGRTLEGLEYQIARARRTAHVLNAHSRFTWKDTRTGQKFVEDGVPAEALIAKAAQLEREMKTLPFVKQPRTEEPYKTPETTFGQYFVASVILITLFGFHAPKWLLERKIWRLKVEEWCVAYWVIGMAGIVGYGVVSQVLATESFWQAAMIVLGTAFACYLFLTPSTGEGD